VENWPKDLSPQELAEWLNRQYGEETLMNRLKMRVLEVGPERAVVELPVHPGLYTPHHYIHAGVMISLADTAATLASASAYRGDLAPEQLPVAVSISSQIVANIREGLLVAEATIPHPGRTLVAASTRITDGDGRLLALVSSTHFVRPRSS
jgi:uncharacterized protein (TIGR00369 family)